MTTTSPAPLNFTTYLPLARRTLKELPFREHLQHMSLGFCGEVGELLDAIKKNAIYGKPLDKVNLAEEIGDVAWYVINLVPDLGFQPAVLDTLAAKFKLENKTMALDPVDFLLQFNFAFATTGMVLTTTWEDIKPGDQEAYKALECLTELLLGLAAKFDIPMHVIFEANIAKLQKRYGEKYSDYAALNRDLEGERTTLETSTLAQAADAVR